MNYEQVDKLHIRDLVIPTVIGVHAQERKEPQDIVLNITLYTETIKAAEVDSIALTVNYETLCGKLVEYVRASSFTLIESLADTIAKLLLDTKGVLACRVVLDKPDALESCRSVAVEIFRTSGTSF